MADAEPDDPPEALLHESAEELYEHAPAGYLSSLPNGELVKVNQTLLSWTGYERDELVGRKRLHDLLAPGARIYYETHYAPLLQLQGSVREIAVELVRSDGRRLPVLLNSTLVSDDEGLPRVIRTTVFDASDRRRYEQELLRARADAESRARAALALAHVNEGVVLVGADGQIDAANSAFSDIFGLPADDTVGRELLDAVPEWEQLEGRIPVGGPRERGAPSTLPLVRGGREQWLVVAGVDSGEGIVYTIRDVTADHGLEQLRSDVVATVSHELRTPLTGVYGAAQTLLAHWESLAAETRRDLLELIVDQSERLTRVIDQVLLASRLDTDNLAIEIAAFDVDEALERLTPSISPGERDRLVVESAPAIRAHGDVDSTAQVLANLVDNALKYATGTVRVGVAPERSVVRFTVSDDGPGIPNGERDRVFEKFYRLDPALQRGVGGTGLGLYIAKELVARMHGRIGLVPQSEGTTVFVELPAAE